MHLHDGYECCLHSYSGRITVIRTLCMELTLMPGLHTLTTVFRDVGPTSL